MIKWIFHLEGTGCRFSVNKTLTVVLGSNHNFKVSRPQQKNGNSLLRAFCPLLILARSSEWYIVGIWEEKSASLSASHTCRCQVWGTSSHGPSQVESDFSLHVRLVRIAVVFVALCREEVLYLQQCLGFPPPLPYRPLMHPPPCSCSLFRCDTQHLHPCPHVLVLWFVLCSFHTSLPLVEKIHHSGAAGE